MTPSSRYFHRVRLAAGLMGLLLAYQHHAQAAPPAGPVPAEEGWRMMRRGFADRFTDVTLTNHQGQKVQFFADLVKDRAVVLNFFYTNCEKTCPDSNIKIARMRRELQPAFGRSLRFISISADPERDTPAVLARYARMAVAEADNPDMPDWQLLTGSAEDILSIRRQLGMVELNALKDRDPSQHSSMFIVGNDGTGRWGFVNARLDVELLNMRIKRLAGWTQGVRYGDIQHDYAALMPGVPEGPKTEDLALTPVAASLPVKGQVTGEFLAPERSGQPVRFADLKGKISVFSHLYTVCPHGSKAVLQAMTALNKEFGSRKDFQLVSFARASTRETPAFFKSYAESLSVKDSAPWWFTSLDQPVLETFVTHELGLKAPRPIPAAERLNPLDQYENDLRLVLVDQKGQVRGHYAVFHPDPEASQTAARSLREDVRSLLHIRPTTPASFTPPLSVNP
jgi:cytochrome oxidase Cu insertion factor (SCO1/SenC/PrrC family)